MAKKIELDFFQVGITSVGSLASPLPDPLVYYVSAIKLPVE